jgi:putative aminopeptidase FrvX
MKLKTSVDAIIKWIEELCNIPSPSGFTRQIEDYVCRNGLIERAKKLELNYAVDIYPFYGSDVEATLRAGRDIRHGLIGPGVSASHGYERTHTEGLENTLRLLIEYIK